MGIDVSISIVLSLHGEPVDCGRDLVDCVPKFCCSNKVSNVATSIELVVIGVDAVHPKSVVDQGLGVEHRDVAPRDAHPSVPFHLGPKRLGQAVRLIVPVHDQDDLDHIIAI